MLFSASSFYLSFIGPSKLWLVQQLSTKPLSNMYSLYFPRKCHLVKPSVVVFVYVCTYFVAAGQQWLTFSVGLSWGRLLTVHPFFTWTHELWKWQGGGEWGGGFLLCFPPSLSSPSLEVFIPLWLTQGGQFVDNSHTLAHSVEGEHTQRGFTSVCDPDRWPRIHRLLWELQLHLQSHTGFQ